MKEYKITYKHFGCSKIRTYCNWLSAMGKLGYYLNLQENNPQQGITGVKPLFDTKIEYNSPEDNDGWPMWVEDLKKQLKSNLKTNSMENYDVYNMTPKATQDILGRLVDENNKLKEILRQYKAFAEHIESLQAAFEETTTQNSKNSQL